MANQNPHCGNISQYQYPSVSLLTAGYSDQQMDSSEEIRSTAVKLQNALSVFKVDAAVSGAVRGPSITRYELEVNAGVRLSRLISLTNDIELALGTHSVSIAPVQGKPGIVSIDIPNKRISTLFIRDVIDSPGFLNVDCPTLFALGRDITGNKTVSDMARLNHLFVAGAGGTGKSVLLNSIISSLLYKASPEQLLFLLFDINGLELSIYNRIPHLLSPIITDPKQALEALDWVAGEVDHRRNLLAQNGKRTVTEYNTERLCKSDGKIMPHIVVAFVEIADLMLTERKRIEPLIARIAQTAHICGIHFILMTQRPEAKIFPNSIQANILSRIAFAVNSNRESRVILGTDGAENLTGHGDMLYLPVGALKPLRVQGCYISSEEIQRLAESIRVIAPTHSEESPVRDEAIDGTDHMLSAAIEVMIESGQGSVSYLQRRLNLGYARAARLMDLMESLGIVGPFVGSKPRVVLITRNEWERMKRQ